MGTDDELKAGAAHDIANALSAVLGWVDLTKQGADPREALAAIEVAARAARATARILLGDHDNEVPADLAKTAAAVARLLAPEARSRGVSVSYDAPKAVHSPLGQASAFRCLWNLALNAVQAVSKGGTVRISVAGGRHASVAVVDDGPGMDSDTQERALKGGFSSRKGGHGLGLGVVRRLVAEAGGTLSLDSSPQGTTFSVKLPSITMPRIKAISGMQRRALARRVLVVEDDFSVREMVLTAFELRGIEAVGVSSMREVIQLTTPFDVALVDLTLADASGIEVIRHLRATKMAKRIILASGASEPYLPPDAMPDRWLRKPFDAEQLLDVVADETKREATG